MKMKSLAMVVCLSFLATLAAGGFAARADAKTVIKVAHHLPPTENRNLALEEFAKLVDKKTGGAVEVQIFAGGSLGNERDNQESVRMGSIQMSLANPATIVNFEPLIGVLDLPFLFKDVKHVHEILDGPIGKQMAEAINKKIGLTVMAWFDTIFRDVLTVKPVNGLDDFKGLKIRVPESPVYSRIFRLLGANPTPMPWGDIYTGLQTKVVEGMESAPDSIYNSKFHEVAKYLCLTRHIYNCTMLLVNDKFFKGLPADQQKAVAEAADEASKWLTDVTIKSENDYFEKLKAGGVTITTPNLDPIREAVKPIYKEYGEKLKAVELIDQISKAK